MAEQPNYDVQALQQAFSKALAGPTPAPATAADIPVDDILKFFCEHWDEIKKVLQFLAEEIGGIAVIVVKAIIIAGDLLRSQVCK